MYYFAINNVINLLASVLVNLAPSLWANSRSIMLVISSAESFFLAIKAKIIFFCLSVMAVDEEVGTSDSRIGADAFARTGSGMTVGVGGLTRDGFAWYWTLLASPSDWISL